MKTKEMNKKLQVTKTTITTLENQAQDRVKGGYTYLGPHCAAATIGDDVCWTQYPYC